MLVGRIKDRGPTAFNLSIRNTEVKQQKPDNGQIHQVNTDKMRTKMSLLLLLLPISSKVRCPMLATFLFCFPYEVSHISAMLVLLEKKKHS